MTTSESPVTSKWRAAVWLTVAVGIGLIVRCYGISAECAWYDEINSIDKLDASSLSGFIARIREVEPSMAPFYFILQYGWASVFGDTVLTLRLLSVIFGVLCIPAAFLVADRMFGRFAGCIASVCVALSPIAAFYSQEIRMYSLFGLLCLCAVFTFLRLLEKSHPGWWAAHAVVILLLLWTHLLAPFSLLPMAVLLVLFWRERRSLCIRWCVLQAFLTATVAFWVTTIDFAALEIGSRWVELPGIRRLFSYLLLYGGKAMVHSDEGMGQAVLATRPAMDILLAAIACCSAGTLIVLYVRDLRKDDSVSSRNPSRVPLREAMVFVLLWAALPILALFAYSHFVQPCFTARYAISSSFAFAAMYGAICAFPNRSRTRAILAALVIALSAYQQVVTLSTPGPYRSDFHSLAQFVLANSPPDEVVVGPYWHDRASLAYNLAKAGARNPVELHPVLDDCAALWHVKGKSLWVVLNGAPPYRERVTRFESELSRQHAEYELVVFRGNMPLRAYHIQKPDTPPR